MDFQHIVGLLERYVAAQELIAQSIAGERMSIHGKDEIRGDVKIALGQSDDAPKTPVAKPQEPEAKEFTRSPSGVDLTHRDAVKAALDKLGVEYNKRCATNTLADQLCKVETEAAEAAEPGPKPEAPEDEADKTAIANVTVDEVRKMLAALPRGLQKGGFQWLNTLSWARPAPIGGWRVPDPSACPRVSRTSPRSMPGKDPRPPCSPKRRFKSCPRNDPPWSTGN